MRRQTPPTAAAPACGMSPKMREAIDAKRAKIIAALRADRTATNADISRMVGTFPQYVEALRLELWPDSPARVERRRMIATAQRVDVLPPEAAPTATDHDERAEVALVKRLAGLVGWYEHALDAIADSSQCRRGGACGMCSHCLAAMALRGAPRPFNWMELRAIEKRKTGREFETEAKTRLLTAFKAALDDDRFLIALAGVRLSAELQT